MIIPYGIGMKDWFHSLLIDFPEAIIPILQDEEDWKEIGNNIKMNPEFNEIPSTYGYNDWREYAYDFYYAMQADN